MDDESHVSAVDAHPEGDGCHDEIEALRTKVLQNLAPYGRLHAGVVGAGLMASLSKALGDSFHLLARRSIDETSLAAMPLDYFLDLRRGVVPVGDAKHQVGSMQATDDHGRVTKGQAGDNVLLDLCRSRGREGMDGLAGCQLAQDRKVPVGLAVIVAPLADAMRLVDDAIGHGQRAQELTHPRMCQRFGRKVEQAQVACPCFVGHGTPVVRRHVAVQGRGSDTHGLQVPDLVLHQRDERRDDQGQLVPCHGGQLVTQGLAAPRRQDNQAVTPVEDRLDGRNLVGKQVREAPVELQGLPQRVEDLLHDADPFCGQERRTESGTPPAHKGPEASSRLHGLVAGATLRTGTTLGLGNPNQDGTSQQVAVGQLADRGLSQIGRSHLDEAEATRTLGLAVKHDTRADHFANLGKVGMEVGIADTVSQVGHEQLGRQGDTSDGSVGGHGAPDKSGGVLHRATTVTCVMVRHVL